MQRIAVLGLGIMGGGMARNLLKAGFDVAVYNRTLAKAQPFADVGARIAQTPRDAAQDAEVVLSMVAEDNASRALWLGEEGALAGAKPGTVLIESSTLTTGWVRELAAAAHECGCPFVDAPVRGSKVQAADGELSFLVGGEAAVLEQVRPVLAAMGSRIDHLGPIGSGTTMKLVNNLLAGTQVALLAEGLLLAERAGLDMDKVVPILINGAPGSPIVKGAAARIVARDYTTNFALRWMHKDLTYALDEAVQHNVPLPLVAAAREVFRMAMGQGHADEDFVSVAEALRPQA